MKKNQKSFIVLGAAIVVLAGALTALLLTNGGDGNSTASSSSPQVVSLVSKNDSDLMTMKVTNKNGGYTLKQQKVSDSLTSSQSSAGSSQSEPAITFTVPELEGLPQDGTAAAQAAKYGYGLEANRDLGDVDDLDQYGLKSPAATVELTFADGGSYSYQIGNTTAGDSSQYYLCETGKSRVYTAGLDSILLDPVSALVDKVVLSLASASGSEAEFTQVKVLNADGKSMELKKVDSGYELGNGYPADDSAVTSLTGELASLTATEVTAVHPDAAKLKELGLDSPNATASFTVEGKSYKLSMSKETEGSRYVMRDGVDVVYKVSTESVTWPATDEFSLRRKEVYQQDINGMKSVLLTKQGTTSSLNLSRTKNEAKSTDDSTVYDYKLTDSTGAEHNYNGVYREFYARLTNTKILEEAAVPSGSPAWTLEISYFDKSTTDKLEFYDTGDRRYTVVVNGAPFGKIASSDAEAVLAKFDEALQEEYTPNQSETA